MDLKEKAFIKFINLEKCTNEEFILAQEFYKHANILDKRLFLNAIANILTKCLQILVSLKSNDFALIENIYCEHGLKYSDFIKYFESYYGKEKFNSVLKKQNDTVLSNEVLFEKVKEVLWEPKEISLLATNLGMPINVLKKKVDDYAFNTLKLTKSDYTYYKKLYKAFNAYINFKNFKFNHVLEYIEKYATKNEKIAFDDTSAIIIKNSSIRLNNISNLFNYLDSIHLNIFELYKLLTFTKNSLAYSLLLEFQEFYEYAESVNWQRNALIEKAKVYKVSYDEFLYLAKLYGKDVAKIVDIDEYVWSKRVKTCPDSYAYSEVLIKILNETNKDVIIELFKSNHIIKTHIFNFCYSKSRNLTPDQRRICEKNLMAKYTFYQNSKKTTECFDISMDYVIGYLNSELSLNEYCILNNIYPGLLKRKITKIDDPELSFRFKEKLNSETPIDKSLSVEEKINLILYYIDNGIVINNIYKKFDLIDFFILFKDINPNRVIYPFLSSEEKFKLINLYNPIKYDTFINRDSLINGYFEIKTISGDKRVMTKDEIIFIINFMDSYNIPMHSALFNIALNRYIEGNLDIYKSEEPTLQ